MAEHHLAHETVIGPLDFVAAMAYDIDVHVGPFEGEPRRTVLRVGVTDGQPAVRAPRRCAQWPRDDADCALRSHDSPPFRTEAGRAH